MHTVVVLVENSLPACGLTEIDENCELCRAQLRAVCVCVCVRARARVCAKASEEDRANQGGGGEGTKDGRGEAGIPEVVGLVNVLAKALARLVFVEPYVAVAALRMRACV